MQPLDKQIDREIDMKVQKRIEKQQACFIQEVKKAACTIVLKKIEIFFSANNLLYLNKDSFHKNVYFEEIFKRATSYTYNQYIQTFLSKRCDPLDLQANEEFTFFFKNQCEKFIAKILMEKLSEYKNNKIMSTSIEKMLLQSYGYSDEIISIRLSEVYYNETTEIYNNPFFDYILGGLRSFIDNHAINPPQHINNLELIKNKTLFDYVEYKVKNYVTLLLQEFHSYAIHRAIREICHREERITQFYSNNNVFSKKRVSSEILSKEWISCYRKHGHKWTCFLNSLSD